MKRTLRLLFAAMLWASVAHATPTGQPFDEDTGAGMGAGGTPDSTLISTTSAVFCQGAKMISWQIKATTAGACSALVVQMSTDSTNWQSETATKDSTLTQTLTGSLLAHNLTTGRVATTIPQAPQGLGGSAAATLPPYIPWKWARAKLYFYSLAVTSTPTGVTVTPTVFWDSPDISDAASRPYRPDR